MPPLTRRSFIALSAAAAATSRQLLAAPHHTDAFTLVATQDRTRILRQAALYLHEPPQTLTDFPAPPSPNRPPSPHDFFSESDYFWPNPANPTGPYKEIDGKSNPDNFNGHRRAMIRLSQACPALTAAFVLTRNKPYAQAAAAHLRAWFITPATRMNPNLEYAQGVRNGVHGRSYGIIDTLHLVEVARAATFLAAFFTPTELTTLHQWFRDYLLWLTTSPNGIKERDATNNHSICWSLQAAEFARLINDTATLADLRTRFTTIQLPVQMAPNGSFPRELARTKPYGYSIFNFDCMATLCWSLSSSLPSNNVISTGARSAQRRDPRISDPHTAPSEPWALNPGPSSLTHFTLPDGRSICRAADFLYPYLADKSTWPYPHDIQHWESWPVRSPGLLFCGLACAHPDYLTLWRNLNPDPTDPEVIRNFPIRQPILWVA